MGTKETEEYKKDRDEFYKLLTIRRAKRGQDYFGMPTNRTLYTNGQRIDTSGGKIEWNDPDEEYFKQRRFIAIVTAIFFLACGISTYLLSKNENTDIDNQDTNEILEDIKEEGILTDEEVIQELIDNKPKTLSKSLF